MFEQKKLAVLKIKAKVLQAARCWLSQNDYVEVHGPVIIPAFGNLPCSFEVKYFDKIGCLAQGLYPYASAFAASLGKVYAVAPAFRAEKSIDRRHLAEYWRIQVAQQSDFEGIIPVQEELVSHICRSLLTENSEVLKCLNKSAADLSRVQAPFLRLSYDEAINILQQKGFKVFWGQALDGELERKLSSIYEQPFFVTNFPVSVETSSFESSPERPELTLSSDLLAPHGFGEIGSGAQMIIERKTLSEKMIEENIADSARQWYLDLMCSSSGSQSGFALGVERIVQWICNLADIRETVAFPRFFNGDLV